MGNASRQPNLATRGRRTDVNAEKKLGEEDGQQHIRKDEVQESCHEVRTTGGNLNQSDCTALHLGSALIQPRFMAAALRPPTTPTSPTIKSRNNGSSSIRRCTCAVRNKASLTHSCHHLLHQQLSGHTAWQNTTTPPKQTQGAIIKPIWNQYPGID